MPHIHIYIIFFFFFEKRQPTDSLLSLLAIHALKKQRPQRQSESCLLPKVTGLLYPSVGKSSCGLPLARRCFLPGVLSRMPSTGWGLVIVVYLLGHVWLFVTPWTAAGQSSLSFTISQSLLKLLSIELMMPCNHLILCHPLLLLPSVLSSIRVFSSESALLFRWPKYWASGLTSVLPMNIHVNFL